MFKSHLFKVLIGFCGMILIGLVSLVVINSIKTTPDQEAKVEATVPMPIKVPAKTAKASLPKKSTTAQKAPCTDTFGVC